MSRQQRTASAADGLRTRSEDMHSRPKAENAIGAVALSTAPHNSSPSGPKEMDAESPEATGFENSHAICAVRSAATQPIPPLQPVQGEAKEGPALDLKPVYARGPLSEDAALYRLMTWMSPAYPVGAFAYSSGIEWATEACDITDAASLVAWITALLRHGSLFSDAVIFGQAHGATACENFAALAEIAELAAALAGTKERFLETTAQGAAFVEITRATWPCAALDRLTECWQGPLAYPVAAAVACAGHKIASAPALQAFLHGAASNLVSAGVRLVPLGQTDGQRILATLETPIAQAVERALAARPDDWGTATLRADIASMRHETQYARLFRS